MTANKQCPYRSQEHLCPTSTDFHSEICETICPLCLQGQQVDAIELVASAIMEKSIDRLERENHDKIGFILEDEIK